MRPVSYSTDELLAVAKSFPVTPRILADLGRLLRNFGVSLEEICRPLKQDTALASRVLRMANSVAFAQSEPVSSVEDAAALIGCAEIHRLVGAVTVDQITSADLPLYGFTGRRVRENALLVALLLEELAEPANEDPRAVYTLGLFRSLGKLAHERLAGTAAVATPFVPGGPLPLAEWEERTFGQTGNAASAVVLRAWQVPHEIPQAIAEHYSPAGRSHPLTHLLHLAAGLADKLGYGLPGEAVYWTETEEVTRKAGVDPRGEKRRIDQAFLAFDRLSGALGR